jgi:hypothetical protein
MLDFSASDVGEFHKVVRRHIRSRIERVVPVVRTSSPGQVVDAVFEWAHATGSGLCIRVDGIVRLAENAAVVQHLANSSGLRSSQIDLVVDAQDLPRAVSHQAIRAAIPLSHSARTWVLLAGSFPRAITHMRPEDYEHLVERAEWISWRDNVAQEQDSRSPWFGDFATQSAVYTPSESYPGSPSVRYTTAERYVILRGRRGSTENPTDYGQYIGHARFLQAQTYNRELVETLGDDYTDKIATGRNRSGNQTTWRVASLQRHVQLTGVQVGQFAPARFARR